MHKRWWSGRVTLRARLTAWYVLLMGLTLALFSGYLYLRMECSLLDQMDAALQVTASQALTNLDEENGRLAFQQTEASQLVSRRLSQAGFAVRLLAADGAVWDGFGGYAEVPLWVPSIAGYHTLGTGEARWRVYSQPIQVPGQQSVIWLQVAQSLASLQDVLESLRTQMLLGLPFILVVAGFGGYLLADRALRPIDRITRTAQAISVSQLSQRIRYIGPQDEVARLAITFDRMLDRLQATFERERRFTADAAHELRTPLTALKGRLDVILSRPRTAAEYESVLHDLEQEVDRLIHLSTNLLLLARLDQRRLPWQPQMLDLSELLHVIAEQVRPLADARGLTLTEEVLPELSIVGDPDHLIRLFLNLLDNAVKYTPPGGQVTLRAGKEQTGVWVAVSDTGPGIPSEHLPHLFERFYRVEEARSRESGGAGLGLAIVYEIARWHGGTVEVQSEPGCGATFIIHLPPQPPEAHEVE
ncbi:MAG: sensor histidine kinase [Anaerolineae bacterium]